MKDEVPRWVRRAADKFEERLGHAPYDMEKTFVGRNHLYHIRWETVEQGKVKEHWTITDRHRKKKKSIIKRVFRWICK